MGAYDRGKEGEIRMHQVEVSCHDLVGSRTEGSKKNSCLSTMHKLFSVDFKT